MKTLYILSALGVISLLAEIFGSVPVFSRGKKVLFPVILIGLLGAVAAAIKDWNTNIHYYNNMLTFDNYALLFSIMVCVVSFLWFLMAEDFFRASENKTDRFALILFAVFGAVLMVSYSNMVMLFLGIEILSIPMYVLAGSRKNDLVSNEASIKYFLMGAFATGFLLFGIALLYGFFGSFDITTIAMYLHPPLPSQSKPNDGQIVLLYGGIVFMLTGLSFKVAAVPFHFWTPDVYQGAPTPVTAFMASIVKTAAFAAFLRLFLTCFSVTVNAWLNVIWMLATLTIILGNITAVYQTSVKRMLAYSSISHAGYMLLAVIAMNEYSAGAILYYAAAYSVSTIAAFAVLNIVEKQQQGNKEHVTFENFAGFGKRNPLLAFAMTIAMLSLTGIPPLAGFFGKYYIFYAALHGGYIRIVLIAVAGSLIGVYYYFRIIIKMYSKPTVFPPENDESAGNEISISYLLKILLLITIILTIILGIFPDAVIGLI